MVNQQPGLRERPAQPPRRGVLRGRPAEMRPVRLGVLHIQGGPVQRYQVQAPPERARIGHQPRGLLEQQPQRPGPQPRCGWPSPCGHGRALPSSTGALLPALVARCRKLLWAESPGTNLGAHLALAADYGLADETLAGLVELPASGPGSPPRGSGAGFRNIRATTTCPAGAPKPGKPGPDGPQVRRTAARPRVTTSGRTPKRTCQGGMPRSRRVKRQA
jgi:hypothetical protein